MRKVPRAIHKNLIDSAKSYAMKGSTARRCHVGPSPAGIATWCLEFTIIKGFVACLARDRAGTRAGKLWISARDID